MTAGLFIHLIFIIMISRCPTSHLVLPYAGINRIKYRVRNKCFFLSCSSPAQYKF